MPPATIKVGAAIARILEHIAFLAESVAQLEGEIAQSVAAFQEEMALLQTILGIEETAAAAILTEIGVDMSRFPSATHLASWAGLGPGHRASAGKRKGGQTTKGDVWLRGVRAEVAWAAIRTKGTSFNAPYHRLVQRLGKRKALVAVAHALLVVIYHVLRDRVPYRELGPDYLGPQETARRTRHHLQHLGQLGYTVTLTPKEAA